MNNSSQRPRGRPPGGSDARQRILDAARKRFLEDGYDRATMRAIAHDADVDVALLSYHFGSKRGLFVQALAMALGPADVLAGALAAPPERVPDRVLAAVMNSWEDPDHGPAMRAFVVAAFQHDEVLVAFREYLEREVLSRIVDHLRGPDATRRATGVLTVVIGLVFSRYILTLGPAATLPAREVHSALAPLLRTTVQRGTAPNAGAVRTRPRAPGATPGRSPG